MFCQWMKEFVQVIGRICKLHEASVAEREDLYQDISLALWRSTENFQGQCSHSTWVYRVALNTALSRKRKAARRPKTAELFEYPQSEEKDSRIEWLYDKLRTLKETDRLLVVLYLDGLTYDEMSQILGVSSSSIGVKLHRLKTKLKQLLKEEKHGS